MADSVAIQNRDILIDAIENKLHVYWRMYSKGARGAGAPYAYSNSPSAADSVYELCKALDSVAPGQRVIVKMSDNPLENASNAYTKLQYEYQSPMHAGGMDQGVNSNQMNVVTIMQTFMSAQLEAQNRQHELQMEMYKLQNASGWDRALEMLSNNPPVAQQLINTLSGILGRKGAGAQPTGPRMAGPKNETIEPPEQAEPPTYKAQEDKVKVTDQVQITPQDHKVLEDAVKDMLRIDPEFPHVLAGLVAFYRNKTGKQQYEILRKSLLNEPRK